MKTKKRFFLVTVIFLFLVLVLASGAMAAYPENPIEIVVHASAGGGSDLFVRQVANFLEREGLVKQKIQVSNRTGGGRDGGPQLPRQQEGRSLRVHAVESPAP